MSTRGREYAEGKFKESKKDSENFAKGKQPEKDPEAAYKEKKEEMNQIRKREDFEKKE
jgi:hypothetical protein